MTQASVNQGSGIGSSNAGGSVLGRGMVTEGSGSACDGGIGRGRGRGRGRAADGVIGRGRGKEGASGAGRARGKARGRASDVWRTCYKDLLPSCFYEHKGGFALKKQMLDDRRFPKMHLNLQRLLQVIAHEEQVIEGVKERCSSKHWFANEDISSLEELIGRLKRLKENVGFIANRITAIQAGLDSWQAEQINRKLYYMSFLSIIFLPLSIITGVFGMNVGGVPWTDQKDPALKDGFRNVMLVCVAMLLPIIEPAIRTCYPVASTNTKVKSSLEVL
ncbi:hypothetical protein L1049_008491 [Liquidambar formosana]|uniref:Uncharacterized protein n=1 Tax=Liquidambar formosana TaxID=63359 RepID=A0AAP0S6E6_LIQFO